MASVYMKLEDVGTIEGAATLKINDKDGYFAIDSFSWGAVRNVGIDIGNANNTDGGMVALGEVSISRQCDGASPWITTFLYKPGEKGKTISIVMTKPNRDGSGASPYLVITLEKARVSNYSTSGNDGGMPSESFSLVYTTIKKDYYVEDSAGKIKKGQSVGFDTTTAKITSEATAG